MREPTQAEVDVVEVAITAHNRVSIFTPKERARAAIHALDKLREEPGERHPYNCTCLWCAYL